LTGLHFPERALTRRLNPDKVSDKKGRK
jgi:hypothetical protein